MTTPTVDQLRRAIEIAEKLEALKAELQGIVGASAGKTLLVSKPAGKRMISAAGRARIAAAQRERWARMKGTKPAKAPAKSAAKKGGISSAGRARLARAMKARWAAARAGKAPAPTASKK